MLSVLLLIARANEADDRIVSCCSPSCRRLACDNRKKFHRLAFAPQSVEEQAVSKNANRFGFREMQKRMTHESVLCTERRSSEGSSQPPSLNVHSNKCVGRLGVGRRRVDSTKVLGEQAVARTEQPTHDESVELEVESYLHPAAEEIADTEKAYAESE